MLSQGGEKNRSNQTHPLIATTHLAPLTGNFKYAKSLEGSHISVSVLGKYPPTLDVIFFVSFSDRRRRNDLSEQVFQRGEEG